MAKKLNKTWETTKKDLKGLWTFLHPIVPFGLIYFGGWLPVPGIPSSEPFMFMRTFSKPFVIDEELIIILINNKYYGLANENRFFDNHTLSWIFLIAGLGLLYDFFKKEKRKEKNL